MKAAQSDSKLWDAYKNGDKEAFSFLFRKYYSPLFLYGSKIMQDQNALEDCIQELFMELWKSRSQVEVKSVKAYLFKSLKYKIYRQLSQRKITSEAFLKEDMVFELSHDTFMIHREDETERAKQLIRAFDKLSNRQKEVIYLKYYLGLSYEEVSEIMEINYQVARNLLYLALRSMKKMISMVKLLIFILSLIH
ncbi:RNA polymerase sigma factor [Flavihumibacter cheonanensis]|uniref:RNA polymerase sigma factor n=1 Tax=Flavihumibacter cheonanensis TaxID=1442385 RepID=UPI001EF7D9B8|nr:sigma-70 family RNA polymerase sigma factor [Flavihumibacter cheonanensis]MCG7751692.1 sigma-70 family RNA polymerase sigma factor [Flavihumibacter cheonanensis]